MIHYSGKPGLNVFGSFLKKAEIELLLSEVKSSNAEKPF